jgi:competence protein ComEC
VIANILVLPLITPVIIIGITLLALSWIPIFSDILVWGLNLLLKFIETIITNIDALPYSYLEGIWVSVPMIIALYFLIIAIYNLFEYVSSKKIIVGAIALILTLLVFNVQYILKTDSKIIVFNAGNQVLIELINNGKSTTFASSGLTKRNQNFTASAFDRKNIIKTDDFIVFEDIENSKFPLAYKATINNNNILMISGGNKDVSINEFDKPTDILVIFGKMDMDIKTTVEKVKCKTVVFASNCPPWIVKKWIKELNDIEIDIKIHNVKENGAYIANL